MTSRELLNAAVRVAEEHGLKMCIAVVDAGGNLLDFKRMDGAWIGSVDIAIKKARTAVMFSMRTSLLDSEVQPGGSLYGLENSNGGLITFPGGIPVYDDDGYDVIGAIGAIGVSGSTVQNDELVAQEAINACLS